MQYTGMMALQCVVRGPVLFLYLVLKRKSYAVLLAISVLLLYGLTGLIKYTGTPLTEPAVCHEAFGDDEKQDLRKITEYKFPDIAYYAKFVFPHNNEPTHFRSLGPETLTDANVDVPVIVTAADYSHFKESMNLVRNMNDGIRKAYKDMKLIYFDLGLSDYQRQQLEITCDCEVKTFPFEQLPSHLRILKGYAWKPVCIQLVLNEYPFVLWMDAAVRLKTTNITWLFEKIKRQGVMAGEGAMSIAARTKESTFKFLREPPCLFRRSEFEGTFIAVYQTPFVQKYFMQPWVSCALSKGCMVIDNFPLLHLKCGDVDRYYHECHRFDQSVLSILLHRLYHANIENHMMKRHTFYQYCNQGEEWRILPEFINDYINARWFTGCKYG